MELDIDCVEKLGGKFAVDCQLGSEFEFVFDDLLGRLLLDSCCWALRSKEDGVCSGEDFRLVDEGVDCHQAINALFG